MKVFQSSVTVYASSSSCTLKLLILLLFINSYAFGIEIKEVNEPVINESLRLIFINSCVSQSWGATEFHVLQALSAHCAPVIVRKSVISKIKDDLITTGLISHEILPQLNRILTMFDDWHIFDTNKGDFCVLVPAPDWIALSDLMELAKRLGLLVNEKEYGGNLRLLILNNSFPFNGRGSIKDVAENVMNPLASNKWNIFLMGHGQSDIVAGFSIDEFRDFLIFMNSRRVNAFVYTTCFGAGTNLIEPYTYHNSPLHLNYVVACQCLRFSVSVADTYEDFNQLFYMLDHSADYDTWDKCFQIAFYKTEQHFGSNAYVAYCNEHSLISNFPWIRNPEEEEFHLLSLPLYRAQPYTFAEDQLEDPVVLTPELYALIVLNPCINRPIIAHFFPSIISIADNKFHYFKSLTQPGMKLDGTIFRMFDGMNGEEEQFTYLFGEYECNRDDRLYKYTNVRIENKPIGIWQKFIHIIKHGTAAKIPKFAKIITAECEDGAVIQTVINQELICKFNSGRIAVVACCFLLSCFLAAQCRPVEKTFPENLYNNLMNSSDDLQFFSYVLSILAAGIPLCSWIYSFHVNLSTSYVEWSRERIWKTLSSTEARHYRDEFKRQHQELIDLAAKQHAKAAPTKIG